MKPNKAEELFAMLNETVLIVPVEKIYEAIT